MSSVQLEFPSTSNRTSFGGEDETNLCKKKREENRRRIETESFYYDYHHAILTKLKYRVWYSISFATTKFLFLPFPLDRKEKRENTSEY